MSQQTEQRNTAQTATYRSVYGSCKDTSGLYQPPNPRMRRSTELGVRDRTAPNEFERL